MNDSTQTPNSGGARMPEQNKQALIVTDLNAESAQEKPSSARSKGIYLLPNLFTVSALFAAFYAIVAAMNQHFEAAAIATFVAMFMDMLDGRIARLTNTQSEFGAQLDSLSDMVSFGIAPALMMYAWSLIHLGKLGWLVAFFYTMCTALRLARFNVSSSPLGKGYFQGLSSTAAAAVVATIMWVTSIYQVRGDHFALLLMVVAVGLGLLMVSRIPYRSFKNLNLRGKVPFVVLMAAVLLLVLVAFDPPDFLCVMACSYALSGPFELWLNRMRGLKPMALRDIRKPEDEEDEGETKT